MLKIITSKRLRQLKAAAEENVSLKNRLTKLQLELGLKHRIEIIDEPERVIPERVVPARIVTRKARKP